MGEAGGESDCRNGSTDSRGILEGGSGDDVAGRASILVIASARLKGSEAKLEGDSASESVRSLALEGAVVSKRPVMNLGKESFGPRGFRMWSTLDGALPLEEEAMFLAAFSNVRGRFDEE